MAIVNIAQTAGYSGQIVVDGDSWPALLRRSAFVDMVRCRAITLSELWLIQGFGHPDWAEVPIRAKAAFALRSCVHELPRNSQRTLLGNSMHLGQIGSWLLWCLLGTDKRDVPE